MKRFLALLALCGTAAAQTVNLTVVSDTNRVIRTNFTIGSAQVTGLGTAATNPASAFQPSSAALTNLANSNGSALTNLTGGNVVGTVALASNISGILAISNGGTGSSSASNARTALGLGSAATNDESAFQPASTNLTALASGDGSSLTNVATTDASQLTNFPANVLLTNSSDASFPSFLLRTNGDGGGLTNLTATNFLPAYSGQDGKVLAVATGGTNIEWTAISNTVTDASQLTNFPTLNQNTTGTASNVTGVVQITNGGTGTNSATGARLNLLPSYTGNSNKVLAVNAGETDVEWITPAAGGGTSGVTSVDVSGGTTGLTTSGGPITNSGTITIGGTLSIAAGGTGATNAAAAIEALLPAYTNNADKILALNSNATGLVWTAAGGGSGTVTSVDVSGGSTGMNFTGGPITTNGTLTLGGTLAIGNGGTGAGDAATARVNLLPAYSNNATKALVINSSTNDVEWVAVPSVPVTISQGGTGGTNIAAALHNFSIINTNNDNVLLIPRGDTNATNASTVSSIVAGYSSGGYGTGVVAIGFGTYGYTNYTTAIGTSASADKEYGTAVGYNAFTEGGGASVGFGSYAKDGGAIGYNAETDNGGSAGKNALSINGFAAGENARAYVTNGVQLGTGTNTNANTIQFLTAGSVATNAWSALANSTTIGREIMQAPTNGTDGQVLVWTNSDVAWSSVSGVQADMTNVTGVLGLANGGTAGTNATSARANLLPALETNNIGYVLTVNSNATDVIWGAAGGSAVDLSSTNATGVLPVAKGGTGGTNGNAALTNLGVLGLNLVNIGGTQVTGGNTIVGSGATADDGTGGLGAVAIGRSATASNSAVAIGYAALGRTAGGGIGAVAVGYQATSTNRGAAIGHLSVNGGDGGAIGFSARSLDGFAGGDSAVASATNASQIGTGTNTNNNSIQFMSAGSVDTNEWARIAELSTYPTTNISVVGTNNTNTLVFSNGILVEVQ